MHFIFNFIWSAFLVLVNKSNSKPTSKTITPITKQIRSLLQIYYVRINAVCWKNKNYFAPTNVTLCRYRDTITRDTNC